MTKFSFRIENPLSAITGGLWSGSERNLVGGRCCAVVRDQGLGKFIWSTSLRRPLSNFPGCNHSTSMSTIFPSRDLTESKSRYHLILRRLTKKLNHSWLTKSDLGIAYERYRNLVYFVKRWLAMIVSAAYTLRGMRRYSYSEKMWQRIYIFRVL